MDWKVQNEMKKQYEEFSKLKNKEIKKCKHNTPINHLCRFCVLEYQAEQSGNPCLGIEPVINTEYKRNIRR